MKIKKITVLLMATLLCAAAFSVTALAAEGTTVTAATETTSATQAEPTGEAKWEIGNKRYYGTFDQAINALSKTGGSITLLTDAHLTERLMLNADISVNGDHTLYIENYVYIFETINVTLNCSVDLSGEVENAGNIYIKCVASKRSNGKYKGNEPLELHHWNSGSIDKEPTYDEEGAIRYVCFDCFTVKFDSLPKLVRKNTRDVITLVLSLSLLGIVIICAAGITVTQLWNKKHKAAESGGEDAATRE